MLTVRPSYSVKFVVMALLLLLILCDCGQRPTTTIKVEPAVIPIHNSTLHSGSHVETKKSVSSPVRLIIPAIGVNAAIERVEIAADSNLSTPKGHPWDDAGWYDLGIRPGERGSAVIDGHLDRPGGLPAVFWNLHKLHRGDRVNVIESQEKTLHFRVVQVAFYTFQTAPLQNIFGNDSSRSLNLITCAGDWISSQHQTTLRLVVYTQFVS